MNRVLVFTYSTFPPFWDKSHTGINTHIERILLILAILIDIDRYVITSRCVVHLRPDDKRAGYFYPNQSRRLKIQAIFFFSSTSIEKLRIISQTNYLAVVYLLVKPKNLNLFFKSLCP